MFRRTKDVVLAVLALGAIAVGASAIAQAASDNSDSNGSADTATQTAPQAPDRSNGAAPQHPGETLLTDGTADQVKTAALAKVPGATVIRVETDAEGSRPMRPTCASRTAAR